LTPYSHRGRSGWAGYIFLGISVLLASVTLFMAVTDRSLGDLRDGSLFSSGDSSRSGQNLATSLTPEVSPTPTPEPPIQVPADVDLTAPAAFVVFPETDMVLFERDSDLPLQPASTAKIFTALVVLEYAAPEEVIEITQADVVDPVAESSMGLQAGDWVTVHDLLVGLMLPSGNDAASALSRTIGARIDGPDDEPYDARFIREMNRKAEDLGLDTVVLKHAAGHDQPGQQVTARDLAVAAEALLERLSLRKIVSMMRAEIKVGGANPRVIVVDNTNELLVYGEVSGVKTGTTAEAGQCLVVVSRHNDSEVISVILGSEDRYGDARALLSLPEPTPEQNGSEDPTLDSSEPLEDPPDPEN
jgi:serine-type D-Ala-D-Ala carboxypeptidase (penicillin-binding protein 5/6)